MWAGQPLKYFARIPSGSKAGAFRLSQGPSVAQRTSAGARASIGSSHVQLFARRSELRKEDIDMRSSITQEKHHFAVTMTLIRHFGSSKQESAEDTRSDSTAEYTSSALSESITLPIRLKSNLQEASVDVYRQPSQEGILVKVTPPDEPHTELAVPLSHVPCDIALVIDVSGSMGDEAPVPSDRDQPEERNGLSVLDLVKHAARTILETLNANDRLGIVTFSDDTRVLQEIKPMTPANKKSTQEAIENMRPLTMTNLWKGITTGIGLFRDMTDSGRVPAIMVLTDGIPNYMSPQQGYIPKLRTLGKLPAPIHTFGFGYKLRSGLLKSIADFSGGNYAFIPDAGMLGTVFVHAVANIQSTFAVNAKLCIVYPTCAQVDQTMGNVLGRNDPVDVDGEDGEPVKTCMLTIPLGSIQYGQTRDLYLRYKLPETESPAILRVELEYNQVTRGVFKSMAQCRMNKDKVLIPANQISGAEWAFHTSRSDFCADISRLFPLTDEEEHKAVPYDSNVISDLVSAWKTLTIEPEFVNDPACGALQKDINGQAWMAISNSDYYRKWGQNYLPSLQSAHAAQQCNSFRDPGPLLYGASSRLFALCRDALDMAFDNLPPPKPSRLMRLRGFQSASTSRSIHMSRYRNPRGVCFASFCRVTLADGRHIYANRLRRGMRVQTPRGPRTVYAVLKTPVTGMPMVSVGSLLITPWHPISHNGQHWVFPCQDDSGCTKRTVRYTGSIYSVLLQPDEDVNAHAISIEGAWVVTLGHGLTEKRGTKVDVRAHPIFGNYRTVCRTLASLGVRKDGVVMNNRSRRSTMRPWQIKKHTSR